MNNTSEKKLKRGKEITQQYFALLDQHIADIVTGKVLDMMTLKEIADKLFISQGHLTYTIQQITNHHPCYFYDQKILEQAKLMLKKPNNSIADIAKILTYDPSNFSKFFKKVTGETPGQFRIQFNLNS